MVPKANTKTDDNSPIGMLVSDNCIMYHLNKTSKDKQTLYYICNKKRSTVCTASAIVNRISVTLEGGVKQERHIVKKCASLEDHNHVGNEAEFLAEKIMLEKSVKAQVLELKYFTILVGNSIYTSIYFLFS